jgi:hypothetical protein
VNVVERKLRLREHFKNAVTRRDGGICRKCGWKADPTKLEVHLIAVGLHDGGFVEENGILLCFGCRVKANYHNVHNGEKSVKGYGPDELYGVIGSSSELAVRASNRLGG